LFGATRILRWRLRIVFGVHAPPDPASSGDVEHACRERPAARTAASASSFSSARPPIAARPAGVSGRRLRRRGRSHLGRWCGQPRQARPPRRAARRDRRRDARCPTDVRALGPPGPGPPPISPPGGGMTPRRPERPPRRSVGAFWSGEDDAD
jgi:hypothetical protein